MFKGAFIFLCGIAAGALLYDTAIERATVKMPRMAISQPYAESLKLTHPVSCDATVNGKCYIRGMK
jgi:hypothetical protein